MCRIILTIWIYIKHFIGIYTLNIGSVENELKYVKDKVKSIDFEELTHLVSYKKDFIDEQCDSITVMKKGSDDCDGFNRLVQCFLYNKGKEAYLVSYWAKPFRKSHTTCIVRSRGRFIDYDYGYKGKSFKTLKECVENIGNRYHSKVVSYVLQDIEWEVLWRIKK